MKNQKKILGAVSRVCLALGLSALVASGLVGCGQKGPLVLPSSVQSQ
jgi:predicted small lipoprotein YifL